MKQALKTFFGIQALCYIILFCTVIVFAPIAGVIVLSNLVNSNFCFCLFIAAPMSFALAWTVFGWLSKRWDSIVDKLSGKRG